MIKLAEKYGDKPAAELPMLFQRILQTTILDYFRREKVRNTWVSLFSGMAPAGGDNEDFDILESYAAEEGSAAAEKLIGAKSLEAVFEVQSNYLKSAYEGFVAQSAKLGEIYAGLAQETYKPYETLFAKAK